MFSELKKYEVNGTNVWIGKLYKVNNIKQEKPINFHIRPLNKKDAEQMGKLSECIYHYLKNGEECFIHKHTKEYFYEVFNDHKIKYIGVFVGEKLVGMSYIRLCENQKDLQQKLKFMPYAKYLFISALTGQRVHKILSTAKYCYDNYSKRVSTGLLNDVISKAVLMKEPPVVALKRLKIYYATQVATKPPKFVFFVNDPNLLHFSYGRYLENQLRESFDFDGTGIEIEYRARKE